MEKGGDYPWELRPGPFAPEDFDSLAPSHWALLVQEVDRLVPDVSRLLDPFDFLPNWRLDDIMVSYAPGEGGVGAHIDDYDVFLIQGLGRRSWKIQTQPVEQEVLVPDMDVRILTDFLPDQEWVLEPGDMLYLPPRVAHYGVALGDCMTYSIGCRAPGRRELLAAFLESRLEDDSPELRFSDAANTSTDHPGMIGPGIKAFAREALVQALGEIDRNDEWLGRFLSSSFRGQIVEEPADYLEWTELRNVLLNGGALVATVAGQVLFDRSASGNLRLYVSGESIPVSSGFYPLLGAITDRAGVNKNMVPLIESSAEGRELVTDLYNSGMLRFC